MEINIEDNRDENTTRNQQIQKSFYDRYGFDERDGPPEEEKEECGYADYSNDKV